MIILKRFFYHVRFGQTLYELTLELTIQLSFPRKYLPAKWSKVAQKYPVTFKWLANDHNKFSIFSFQQDHVSDKFILKLLKSSDQTCLLTIGWGSVQDSSDSAPDTVRPQWVLRPRCDWTRTTWKSNKFRKICRTYCYNWWAEIFST